MTETSQSPASPPDPSGMPWWAKTLYQVGMTFGIPVILIGWYLAQDAGWVPNPVHADLEALKGIVLRHESTTAEMVKVMQEEARKRQLRCALRAKTEAETKACFPQP